MVNDLIDKQDEVSIQQRLIDAEKEALLRNKEYSENFHQSHLERGNP